MKIVTLFPSFKNLHFYKDPGQIAYRFQKAGYNALVVCYKNEKDYSKTKLYIPVLTVLNNKISRKFNLGLTSFLIKNSRGIDILNLFHLKWDSLFFAFVYKLINPSGFVYLKMDNCYYSGFYPWEQFLNIRKGGSNFPLVNTSLKNRLKKLFTPKLTKYVDLWSIEDKVSCEYYKKKYPSFNDNIITSLNGHTLDIEKFTSEIEFSQKKNIVFSVGRLGTQQKATENLLEAFVSVAHNSNWILHLAGSIEEPFKWFIEDFFQRYPELISRVIFNGILEKRALFELYNRSKIFCLPSRWEGFANVFSEAMYFKNAIVTTPATSVRDIVIENQFGELVEVDNVEQLSEILLKIINNPSLNELYANNAREFCDKNLSWDLITEKLQTEIESRMALKNRHQNRIF